MLDLWLVRHAESEGNRSGTEADTPLTASGRAQAAALAATLAGERFDQVFCSDLLRCQETARLALPGVAVRLDPGSASWSRARRCFLDVNRMTPKPLVGPPSLPAWAQFLRPWSTPR
jgi:broad specificity phosphatase PhoE